MVPVGKRKSENGDELIATSASFSRKAKKIAKNGEEALASRTKEPQNENTTVQSIPHVLLSTPNSKESSSPTSSPSSSPTASLRELNTLIQSANRRANAVLSSHQREINVDKEICSPSSSSSNRTRSVCWSSSSSRSDLAFSVSSAFDSLSANLRALRVIEDQDAQNAAEKERNFQRKIQDLTEQLEDIRLQKDKECQNLKDINLDLHSSLKIKTSELESEHQLRLESEKALLEFRRKSLEEKHLLEEESKATFSRLQEQAVLAENRFDTLLSQERDSHQSVCKDLESRIRELECEAGEARKAFDVELSDLKRELNALYEEKESERSRLQEQVALAENRCNALLLQERNLHRSVCKDLESRIRELECAAEETKSAFDAESFAWKNQLQSMEYEYVQKIETLSTSLVSIRESFEALISDLSVQLESVQSEKENQVASLETILSQERSEHEKSRDKLRKIMTLYDSKTIELQSVRSSNDRLWKENEQLQSEIDSLREVAESSSSSSSLSSDSSSTCDNLDSFSQVESGHTSVHQNSSCPSISTEPTTQASDFDQSARVAFEIAMRARDAAEADRSRLNVENQRLKEKVKRMHDLCFTKIQENETVNDLLQAEKRKTEKLQRLIDSVRQEDD